MGRVVPSDSEVIAMVKDLSNWSRWGPDDERGTLNLVTPERILAALRLPTDGVSVSCARQIVFESDPIPTDVRYQTQHFMLKSGESKPKTRESSAADYVAFAIHGLTMTHVDSLSHRIWDGEIYNGRPSSVVTTADGATMNSIEAWKNGIITRGVLLDIAGAKKKPWLEAGEPIFPEDLDEAETLQGVRVAEGDALLIRTGWPKRRAEKGAWPIPRQRPGLHVTCASWLKERGVAVVAPDAANEVWPAGYPSFDSPFHVVAIVAMGLCLVDSCQFEELVVACEERKRWDFLFMISVLRIKGGTASPANPIAVF
jgi:kynurenine formamidase